MSSYNETKAGHPVLGVVLGILGILCALFLCLIGGVIGGAIALILGALAIVIGLSARKNGGKGIAAVIAGALAVLLAIVMTVSTVTLFNRIKETAGKYADEAPLIVKCLDNPSLSIIGMVMNIPDGEGTAHELIEQFNFINEKVKNLDLPSDITKAPAEAVPTAETPTEEPTAEPAG